MTKSIKSRQKRRNRRKEQKPRSTPQSPLDDPRLRPSEAGALIGVSERTLQRYEVMGLIVAERTPTGERRYRRSHLLRLLTEANAYVPSPKRVASIKAARAARRSKHLVVKEVSV